MSTTQTQKVTLTPTGAALGAVVGDLDATQLLSAADALALRRGLLDHHILIYKKQDLSEPQFKAFATHFGAVFQPPSDVPVLASAANGVTPEIVRVSNVDGYTGTGELSPHSDHHWTPFPSAASFLYALEVPPVGGDTTWYNMHLAYETLDARTKERIDALQLITYNPFLFKEGETRPRYRDPQKPLIAPTHPHPLVRTHPDSGKRILFLDYATEVEVLGLSPREGEELVEQLRAHFHQERFRYTHKWSVGDIVHWDNQATLHARTAFDPNSRRVMKRISIAGGRPF